MNHGDTGLPPEEPTPQIEPLALFEILARENGDSLTAFLRASVDDQIAVDDLFQEAMLVAWRRIGEYDRARPFGAWLRGIAKRLVLAHYRTAGRTVPLASEQIVEFLDRRMSQIDRQPGDAFEDRIVALLDCIERLASSYREPIDLHYRQCKTAEWIARHLATSREAVQKRLQRARLQLAECLERKGLWVSVG